MSSSLTVSRRVGFAVGTGRCGTTFLSRLMELQKGVASSHCRHPLVETFHRYCQWYELPVDDAGFLATMEAGICEDLKTHHYSFESSGYLSLSISALHLQYGCRFVLLVRRPDKVVNSHINKGWYASPFVQADPECALGYQSCTDFHHFLGRFAPRGDAFTPWNALTQVGKLAWYWTTLNQAVLDQFRDLPQADWRVQRIEDLDFSAYCELAEFLGFEPTVDQQRFDALVAEKPNARPGRPSTEMWSEQESAEFEVGVASLADELGYSWRIDELTLSDRDVPPTEGRRSSWWR